MQLLEKMPESFSPPQERKVVTTCTIDCGAKCPLIHHVNEGVITKISVWKDGQNPPLQACFKGLNYHWKAYAPDRLKYPLIRVGERGEGRFRRVSWEEALDTVAGQIKRIGETYGPNSILNACSAGSGGLVHSTHGSSSPDAPPSVMKLLNMLGGKTTIATALSDQGAHFAAQVTYGVDDRSDANNFADMPNSKLIILWGFNPCGMRWGTTTVWHLLKAKKKGIKIVVIDPCRTETAKAFGDEWIPIRPGTDTAMMLAMAYTMITEELYDKVYVEKFVFGFDAFSDYALGTADGVPKTPQWAEKTTGVPAETIKRLAREFAANKPAAFIQGFAPGRTAYGENYHRVGIALQAMTGNVGVHGGSGSCGWKYGRRGFTGHATPAEPLDGSQVWYKDRRLKWGGEGVEIVGGKWADAVLRGKAGGYPSDIKMIYVIGHNILTQRQNPAKGVEAFKKVEFVVCHEQFMTTSARYADVVLPVNTNLERNDISGGDGGAYAIYANKVIDSMYGSKTDFEILSELAARLGLADFNPKTEEEWLRSGFEESIIKDSMSYEEFREKGTVRLDHAYGEDKEPHIAFKKQIEDPENNPFPTPSGKIEIYSQRLERADFEAAREYSGVISQFGNVPKMPMFIEHEELPTSPKAQRYPLQLTTPHSNFRVHSQFVNIAPMKKYDKHEMWINPTDAASRRIKSGDRVKVFNDNGATRISAKVTDRMMQGVIRIYEGGWYKPGPDGVDEGGNANVLINDMLTSPAGSNNYNGALVEVQRES